MTTYDWPAALAHVDDVKLMLRGYAKVYSLGAENVLMVYVQPLIWRYEAGERSAELYEAMLRLEVKGGNR